MPKQGKGRGPRQFTNKVRAARDNFPPPRIIVVGEGEMEIECLQQVVRNIIDWQGWQIQPLRTTSRIEIGGDVPPAVIAQKFVRLAKLLLSRQDVEGVCGLIDHEDRNVSWDEFIESCRKAVRERCENDDRYSIAVASRSIEAWILADVEQAATIVRPTKANPRQDKYLRVETISHPVEDELKKYWPEYKKTKQGPLLLKGIRPQIVTDHSESFTDFVTTLEQINTVVSN